MLLHPVPPVPPPMRYAFSFVHFLAFMILGFLVGLSRNVWSSYRWFVLLLLWCVGSEILQRYTGRCCETVDMFQNATGSAFGLLCAAWTRRLVILPARDAKRPGAVGILFRTSINDANVNSIDFSRVATLVVRRSQTVVAPGALCFPGGGVEEGETPEQAVCREFQEEVALEVKARRFLVKNTTPSGAPLYWFWVETFEKDFDKLRIVVQPEEVAGYEWRTLPELLDDDSFLDNNREIVRKIIDGEIPLL